MSAQKQLLEALGRGVRQPYHPLKECGPLVSLIGIRATFDEEIIRTTSIIPGLQDDMLIRILIQILRVDDEKPTLAMALARCYSRGLLVQPLAEDVQTYQFHGKAIMEALGLVNLLFRDSSQRYTYSMYEERSIFQEFPPRDLGVFSGAPHKPLLDLLTEAKPTGGDRPSSQAQGTQFRTQELALPLLRKVGHVRIVWTDYLEDHLLFDPTLRQLRLFWLHPIVAEMLSPK